MLVFVVLIAQCPDAAPLLLLLLLRLPCPLALGLPAPLLVILLLLGSGVDCSGGGNMRREGKNKVYTDHYQRRTGTLLSLITNTILRAR